MPEQEIRSLFDKFGGYYSVSYDDVEVARWAPGLDWSEYVNAHKSDPGFSYRFVTTGV